MIHQTTCDRCGKPVAIKWTPEDIQSMESMGVDWKAIEGRCDDCQEAALREHGYIKPQASTSVQEPLSEEEVRARLPISKQTSTPVKRGIDEGAVYVSPDGLFPK